MVKINFGPKVLTYVPKKGIPNVLGHLNAIRLFYVIVLISSMCMKFAEFNMTSKGKVMITKDRLLVYNMI